jgi:hypothetical protein
MSTNARRRSRARSTFSMAVIAAVLICTALASAHADPTSPPSDADAVKFAAAGSHAAARGPGKYGSNTYYSSDAEEADLHAVADLAESVDAIGSERTGIDSMLIRVPRAATVPDNTVVGAIRVHFEQSRFTANSLAALEHEVSAAAEAAAAAHEPIAIAFGYVAGQDLDVVHGTPPKSLTALAASRSGLYIAGDGRPGDGRDASRSDRSPSAGAGMLGLNAGDLQAVPWNG